MNIDLVENHPSWVYYIYISAPMFMLLLVVVWMLKRWGVRWFKLGKAQYYTSDSANTFESSEDLAVRLKCAAACGDTSQFGPDILVEDSILVDALWMAADNGQLDVVKILVKRVEDVNAQAGGAGEPTALQAAAQNGHRAVVLALIRAGAIDSVGIASKLAQDNGHGKLASILCNPIG